MLSEKTTQYLQEACGAMYTMGDEVNLATIKHYLAEYGFRSAIELNVTGKLLVSTYMYLATGEMVACQALLTPDEVLLKIGQDFMTPEWLVLFSLNQAETDLGQNERVIPTIKKDQVLLDEVEGFTHSLARALMKTAHPQPTN